MEIKIVCQCGARFAFEMEPVDGRMPYAINCPECNADITEAANADIASQADAAPAQVPIPVTGPVSSPPSVAAATPPPYEEAEPDHAVEDVAAVEEAEAEPKPKKKKRKKKKKKAAKVGPNYFLGFVGATLGAAIGMGIWYALARYAGINFGLVAWVVGGLVGFGAMLGAQEQSDGMGILSALLALFAIFAGQYLAIAGWIASGKNMLDLDIIYEIHVEMAKEVVAAKNDRELTAVLRDYQGEVTPADLRDFKKNDLPFFRKLASGQADKDDLKKHLTANLSVWDEFKTSFGLMMYVCIFFGVGTAYRLAGGGTED